MSKTKILLPIALIVMAAFISRDPKSGTAPIGAASSQFSGAKMDAAHCPRRRFNPPTDSESLHNSPGENSRSYDYLSDCIVVIPRTKTENQPNISQILFSAEGRFQSSDVTTNSRLIDHGAVVSTAFNVVRLI